MERIEIRYINKIILPFLILFTIAIIAGNLYWFISGKYANNYLITFLYIITGIFGLYTFYSKFIKIIKNEPVLIFTNEFIELIENSKSTVFTWKEIKSAIIENDDSNFYLKITTEKMTKKISINFLDKSPEQIKLFIQNFKK